MISNENNIFKAQPKQLDSNIKLYWNTFSTHKKKKSVRKSKQAVIRIE